MKVAISGIGILSSIGSGIENFKRALKAGKSNFSMIKVEHLGKHYFYPGATIAGFDFQEAIHRLEIEEAVIKRAKRLRNVSSGVLHGIYTALEAWKDAGLFETAPNFDRVAIVSAGSNTQQASLVNTQERYRENLDFLHPYYGFNSLDTDVIGVLSEILNIKGEGYSVGAASASGNMAIIQGYRLIAGGDFDLVLVVAPSMELSIYEYQGLTTLGAMAVLEKDKQIASLCNPFDKSHCGFVYGQNAGALILESVSHARKRLSPVHCLLTGYGSSLDSNRNPNPSVAGESKAMQQALNKAALEIDQIDYINTHGTASVIGDETELQAILSLGGKGIRANATKGLIGHGITAAGLVEAIACIVQMNESFLHPNPNLKDPISDAITWIQEDSLALDLNYCMSNSFGFGGINTSIIFQAQK